MDETNDYYKHYKKSDPVMDAYYKMRAENVKKELVVKEKTKADEIREYLAQQELKTKIKKK